MQFASADQQRWTQLNLAMAYLAYTGQGIATNTLDAVAVGKLTAVAIARQMAGLPPCKNAADEVDWRVVWGPANYTFAGALLQDNAMFVAEQISRPGNLVVAIRGTNGAAMLDWITEDLDVWSKVAWDSAASGALGQPAISRATHDGVTALLHHLRPTAGLPGAGQSIEAFLGSRAAPSVSISFTGHSLAGALAPTLALWFSERQGHEGGWDPNGVARISTVTFAGATPGNEDFAKLFDTQLGERCMRIHNTLDIVPHAWDAVGMSTVSELYASAGTRPNLLERALIEGIRLTVDGYAPLKLSMPFSWAIQPGKLLFLEQAMLQHVRAYPSALGVPELLELPQFAATAVVGASPAKVVRLITKTATRGIEQALHAAGDRIASLLEHLPAGLLKHLPVARAVARNTQR